MRNVLFSTVLLVSSISAWAEFDAAKILKEAIDLQSNAGQIVEDNITQINISQKKLSLVSKQLADVKTLNSTLKQMNKTCAANLNKLSADTVIEWKNRYIEELSYKTEINLQQLKVNVQKYLKFENCADCDQEIKDANLAKYKENILGNFQEIANTEFFVFAKFDQVSDVISENICDYSNLFKFSDSKKFTDLFDWDAEGSKYSSVLSPKDIIELKYNDTLEFIAKNAPILVNRDAKKFGSPESRFNSRRSIVNVSLAYNSNIITGVENVSHPEVRNPILIIHNEIILNTVHFPSMEK